MQEVLAEDAIAELWQTLSVKGNGVSSLRLKGCARTAGGELLVRARGVRLRPFRSRAWYFGVGPACSNCNL